MKLTTYRFDRAARVEPGDLFKCSVLHHGQRYLFTEHIMQHRVIDTVTVCDHDDGTTKATFSHNIAMSPDECAREAITEIFVDRTIDEEERLGRLQALRAFIEDLMNKIG